MSICSCNMLSPNMPSPNMPNGPDVFNCLVDRGDIPVPISIPPVIWPSHTREYGDRDTFTRCVACDIDLPGIRSANGSTCHFCADCRLLLRNENKNQRTARMCARMALVCKYSYQRYKWRAESCRWKPLWHINVDIEIKYSNASKWQGVASVPLAYVHKWGCLRNGEYTFLVESRPEVFATDHLMTHISAKRFYISLGTLKIPVATGHRHSLQKNSQRLAVCVAGLSPASVSVSPIVYWVDTILLNTAPRSWWKPPYGFNTLAHEQLSSFISDTENGLRITGDVNEIMRALSCISETERTAYTIRLECLRREYEESMQHIAEVTGDTASRLKVAAEEVLGLLQISRKRKR